MLVLSRPGLSVAQFGGHALTDCPPCVHPDRRLDSRGAQRPEQGTGHPCRTTASSRRSRRSRAAGLSPDGKWLAYGINRSNRDNELRVAPWRPATPKIVAFGSQATFSADSRWLAYAIGHSEAQEEKLRQQKKPIQRKLGTLTPGLGRDDDGRRHRDVRLQRQRHPPGDEALRAGAQGSARAPRRRRRRRRARRSSSASWQPAATRRSAT